MINGSTQPLKFEIELPLIIGEHTEDLVLQIADISPVPVILGIIWLETHNLDIN